MFGQGVGGVWWVVLTPYNLNVQTAPAQMLTTAAGLTLYLFTPDKPNQSACTGACAKYWPPLLVPAGTQVTTTFGLSGTFGVASRSDGTQQLTYDGAPLYTFIKDKKPGDVYGQGAEGVWWIVATGAQTSTATVDPAGAVLTSLVKTAPAQILVTGRGGLTLYLFNPDKKNQSVCTATCAKYWPPLLLPAEAPAPTAQLSLGGVWDMAPRAGGARQLTYDGAPLYTFIKDKNPGDMFGQGADGVWWTIVVP
jgi:predicted lipoprotein with Yx(FWY)xxD motif